MPITPEQRRAAAEWLLRDYPGGSPMQDTRAAQDRAMDLRDLFWVYYRAAKFGGVSEAEVDSLAELGNEVERHFTRMGMRHLQQEENLGDPTFGT